VMPGDSCLDAVAAVLPNVGTQPLASLVDALTLTSQLPAVLMPVHPALGKDRGYGHKRSSQNKWQKPAEIVSKHCFLLKLRRFCFSCINARQGQKSRFTNNAHYPIILTSGPGGPLPVALQVKQSRSLLYDGKGRI